MSEPPKMTLRVQSAEGTARVQAAPGEPTAALYERVHAALGLASFAFALHTDRARRVELPSSKSRRLVDAGLKHGDMLYLSPVNGAVLFDTAAPAAAPAPASAPAPSAAADDDDDSMQSAGPSSAVVGAGAVAGAGGTDAGRPEEDEVDLELYQADGSIQRQRDDKLCRHNSKGSCVHCAPLEPWDAGYLQAHNIKHMSFHAYLRKITSGKFVSLEEMSCKIKPGCKEHPPWPRGVCSACQPAPVTLTRQPYRHVDNVVVEHGALVERFLGYWRASGRQRVGLLYGRYERHGGVPLGVRARVAAVYEPAQAGRRDAVRLLPDAKRAALDEVAAGLALRRVGWIFTDLLPDGDGRVKHLRGVDTHFLTAQECCTAGQWQHDHPSPCRHAPSGYFGSKFVTVCVTGDADRRVHLEGYQVSQQCQALVRDGVLVPTRDAPELGYIRDSSDQQYVPDVFYKEKDAYGNEVGGAARRVPVAYLLVDVPAGVAAGGQPSLAPGAAFPPAHRALPGQLQSLAALQRHLQAAPSFLEAVSDLHVLLYMATNEALPLRGAALAPLLAAVRSRDAAAAAAWRREPQPATLLQLAAHAAEGAEAAPAAGPAPAWTCPLCTFHNAATRDACEMCAMPRNSDM